MNNVCPPISAITALPSSSNDNTSTFSSIFARTASLLDASAKQSCVKHITSVIGWKPATSPVAESL